MSKILRKLHLEGNEFVVSEDIKRYCDNFGLDYNNTVRYLASRGNLVRIFKGIFYLKSFDEMKLGKMKYSHLELVSKGMELKGVVNWYFGLNTALRLNNATHEYFPVDYVLSDKIFRNRPMNVAGYGFRFVKLKSKLFGFGVKEDRYRYSDLEKTILDLIYVWRYNSVPREKILLDIGEYAGNASKNKMEEYSAHYPKTVADLVEELI